MTIAKKIGYGPAARELALATAKLQIAEASARIIAGTSGSDSAIVAVDEAATPIDYDAMMQANLTRVFGELDPSRRITAIRALYAEDAVLHEPDHSAHGHDAISQAVTDLLAHLPPDFAFSAIRPALGHNGVGRLQWSAGPQGGPAAVTGTDVAHIEGRLIRSLHVFLDQAGT